MSKKIFSLVKAFMEMSDEQKEELGRQAYWKLKAHLTKKKPK